jgi:uncharacterized protein
MIVMTKMDKNYERRAVNYEARMVSDDSGNYVEGYAAKFDTRSEDFGGWEETIATGAFDDVLGDDVRALIDHNPEKIIGRSKSGTLSLVVDDIGLKYRALIPDTTYGNDLKKSLERGDIDQSSFGFRVKDADWETRDGKEVRVIKKLERLFDVSPVTFPAYQDTSVAKRSLQEQQETKETAKQADIDAKRADSAIKIAEATIALG